MAGAPLANNVDAVARGRGCMLGLMVGDALGAAVEGFERKEIRALAQERWGSHFINGFLAAVPMGTFVPGSEPGTYRPARDVRDCNFVPVGPASNEAVARQCAREGMYTDDSLASLALASSIAERGGVDSAHAARRCAEFFRDNEAFRGCPPTAKAVMEATLRGVPPEETGLPPHFGFAGGSFANGGAMRISPLAVAYRGADAVALRRAVTAAILASHRHPEAVDFAVLQAAAVQHAMCCASPADFDPKRATGAALLQDLAGRCEVEAMQGVVAATAEALRSFEEGGDEQAAVRGVVDSVSRPGSGMGFQIASVHMAPCVLWAAFRHHADPRLAVQTAIDLGGDTDTTAAMVGAIVGALHGEAWCADWAAGIENGAHGRDYALGLGTQLATLDLRD